MVVRVPVTIAAKNEGRCIGACLDAVLAAVAFARGQAEFDVLVVADDCSDDTEAVARGRGVAVLRSSGGKVEAQRAGLRAGEFNVFLDADVIVTPPTLRAMAEVMRARAEVMVAWPRRRPLPPVQSTWLARALHVYNKERGFSSQRTWFNGKCFAMRGWSVPTRAELAGRIAGLPDDNFYDYAAGMRVDDIYLSRKVVAEHGPAALVETTEGCVYYRAPETLRGMYRYYRRMRMEIERVSALFPELNGAHGKFGTRGADLLAEATLTDKIAYCEFQLALAVCRAGYLVERAYYQHVADARCPAWPPVEETKCSLVTEIPG